jgi:hypothetical protein
VTTATTSDGHTATAATTSDDGHASDGRHDQRRPPRPVTTVAAGDDQ